MPWTTQHPPAALAVELMEAIYADHSAGCCLHIVLDDNNIGNDSIWWCREYTNHYASATDSKVAARGRICQRCDDCAKVLLMLSMTARRKAMSIWEQEQNRRMHAERAAREHKVGWVRLVCEGDAQT